MINYEDFENCQKEAAKANRLVDYLENNLLNYLIKALNGDLDGGVGKRYNWRERGFIPVVRNIVRPIVEKSAGQLFVKNPGYYILPATNTEAKPVIDPRLLEIFNASDMSEHLQNINIYARTLQSICIYLEKYIPEERLVTGIYQFDSAKGDALLPHILHVGNSVVRTNPQRTMVTELAYITKGKVGTDCWEYRYVGPEWIIDYRVENSVEIEIDRQENPDGIVAAVMHYDTKKPATGIWSPVPDDIRTLQEALNIHLTDLNFGAAANIGKPLYTNAKFKRPSDSNDDNRSTIVGQNSDTMTRRFDQPGEKGSGGIGAVIHIDSPREGNTFVEHRGPEVDLMAQHQLLEAMINSLATDWSVNLKVAGDGSANSGFQLIVEELDNLRLQEQRQLSFKGTFRRMYDILKVMYPELTDGIMEVEFNPPALPVNQKEQEDVWQQKIEGGRASVIDYLMITEGLTRKEALARKKQIEDDNKLFSEPEPVALPTPNNQPNINNISNQQNIDE